MRQKQIYIIFTLVFFSLISFGQDTLILNKCYKNELAAICKRINIKYLKIKFYESNELPENLGDLENLEYLEISFGKIATIPKSIGNLNKLKSLTLCNGYTKIIIPPEIGELVELKELNIYNYHFDSLPRQIGKLVNLEKVMICGDLFELPNTISSWKKIKSLYLSGNNLIQIPQYFYWFSQLEYLDLTNNAITFISDSIKYLENLEVLSLEGNFEIMKLPETLCELKKLKSIYIQNTQINGLPTCLTQNETLVKIKMCKTLIENPEKFNSDLSGKVEWEWRCRGLESYLVDYYKIYGKYNLKYQTKKDSMFLDISYFYNEPGVIDEEFTREIHLKIANRDSLKINKIYTASNSNFIITTSRFSIWDWSKSDKNNIKGYVLFKEIKSRKCVVYLKLDLIDNEGTINLIDELLEF